MRLAVLHPLACASLFALLVAAPPATARAQDDASSPVVAAAPTADFDHCLKGAPVPTWMSDGVPDLRKGEPPTA